MARLGLAWPANESEREREKKTEKKKRLRSDEIVPPAQIRRQVSNAKTERASLAPTNRPRPGPGA